MSASVSLLLCVCVLNINRISFSILALNRNDILLVCITRIKITIFSLSLFPYFPFNSNEKRERFNNFLFRWRETYRKRKMPFLWSYFAWQNILNVQFVLLPLKLNTCMQVASAFSLKIECCGLLKIRSQRLRFVLSTKLPFRQNGRVKFAK